MGKTKENEPFLFWCNIWDPEAYLFAEKMWVEEQIK